MKTITASAIFLSLSLSLGVAICWGDVNGATTPPAVLENGSVKEVSSNPDTKILSKTKRNVVFLLTDDQAIISMGCYGNPKVKTPNLDTLAADGVIFDRHYVTTAICMASRCNIMTGLYEFRTGCNFGYGKLPLQRWENSYPMLMRSAGYRTAMAGKIGFEVEGKKALPKDDFDMWGASPGQTTYNTAKNRSMAKYAKKFPHATLAYAAFAEDFIKQSVADEKPFCLSISFKASHRPVTPDPQFNDVYKDTVFDKPANYGREKGLHLAPQSRTGRQYPRFEEWGYSDNYNDVMKKYNQQIYGVDQAIGRIRESLKAHGVEKNTVIIFTSDNGFMCGSHGYGSKVIPYEESTNVPLIIYDPLHSSAGKKQRCDALTGSIDLCPTMLEMAGLEPLTNIDGVSLVPLLDDPAAEVRKSLSLMNFWSNKSCNSFGVVTKKWKYLYWYSHEKGMIATEEMFDMGSDRSESANVAYDEQNKSQLDEMRELYDRHLYEIERNAINDNYGKYKDLFDRRQLWDVKEKILSEKKADRKKRKVK